MCRAKNRTPGLYRVKQVCLRINYATLIHILLCLINLIFSFPMSCQCSLYSFPPLFVSRVFWFINVLNVEKKSQRPHRRTLPRYLHPYITPLSSSHQLPHSQGHILIMKRSFKDTHILKKGERFSRPKPGCH